MYQRVHWPGQFVHPLGRPLAPVVVPHIADDQSRLARIPLEGLFHDDRSALGTGTLVQRAAAGVQRQRLSLGSGGSAAAAAPSSAATMTKTLARLRITISPPVVPYARIEKFPETVLPTADFSIAVRVLDVIGQAVRRDVCRVGRWERLVFGEDLLRLACFPAGRQ